MKTLTPKQKKAVGVLITNWDVAAAATAVGVSRVTLYTWLVKAEFKAALDTSSGLALENVSRGLVALSTAALDTLRQVLDDPNTPAGVKIRAAEVILSNLLKLRVEIELERRILALEERVDK